MSYTRRTVIPPPPSALWTAPDQWSYIQLRYAKHGYALFTAPLPSPSSRAPALSTVGSSFEGSALVGVWSRKGKGYARGWCCSWWGELFFYFGRNRKESEDVRNARSMGLETKFLFGFWSGKENNKKTRKSGEWAIRSRDLDVRPCSPS